MGCLLLMCPTIAEPMIQAFHLFPNSQYALKTNGWKPKMEDGRWWAPFQLGDVQVQSVSFRGSRWRVKRYHLQKNGAKWCLSWWPVMITIAGKGVRGFRFKLCTSSTVIRSVIKTRGRSWCCHFHNSTKEVPSNISGDGWGNLCGVWRSFGRQMKKHPKNERLSSKILPQFLCGGFKYLWFSSLPGGMIQFDEHIFQTGWNHQPDFDEPKKVTWDMSELQWLAEIKVLGESTRWSSWMTSPSQQINHWCWITGMIQNHKLMISSRSPIKVYLLMVYQRSNHKMIFDLGLSYGLPSPDDPVWPKIITRL